MKERIDHSNYEAWLLDRLEGGLTAEQEALLDEFLRAHPELDMDGGGLPTLNDLDARLDQAEKDALKRDLPPTGIGSEPLEDLLIARLEGDLTPDRTEALRHYLLAHPELQRTERIYTRTKLVPRSVVFTAKKDLERDFPPQDTADRYNLDDHLVARLEGDLSAVQERALTAYLAADADAQRQWSLMQRTRVALDPVAYPAKDGLKKGGKVIAIGAARASWAMRLRVAATIAVLLGLATWALLRTPTVDTVPGLVDQPRREAVGPMVADVEEGVQGGDDNSTTEVDGPDTLTDPVPQRATAPTRVSPVPPMENRASIALLEQQPEEQRTAIDPMEPRDPLQGDATLPTAVLLEADVPGSDALAYEDRPSAEVRSEGVPLATFLAGEVRKRVLDPEEDGPRPLDATDAVAAVDKGLRTVAGSGAGLTLDREADGRVSRFQLRLGRNLSISARR